MAGHRLSLHPTRSGLQALVAASLIALVLSLASCGGGGKARPTPAPTTPAGTAASPKPNPSASSGAYSFVYREFGAQADTIWSVSPADPSARRRLASIPHRSDWGVIPSLSPDGKLLAYLTMPDEAFDPTLQAEARLLDLTSGKTSLIAEDVDLHARQRVLQA